LNSVMHSFQVMCSSLLNSWRFWVCCLTTAMTFFNYLFSTVFCNRCTTIRYKVATKFFTKFYICTLQLEKDSILNIASKSLMLIIYSNLCLLHFFK
jgi:hypothetical protein